MQTNPGTTMSECERLVRADKINAFYSTAQKALVISADVVFNPSSDHVQICRNPLEGVSPAPAMHEYMVVGTVREGIYPDLIAKHTICASFPMDATPETIVVYSMGTDKPAKKEVSVVTQPPQTSAPAQAGGQYIRGGTEMNGQNGFIWSGQCSNKINAVVNAQATGLRIVRRALKPVGMQGAYVDSVLGHRVQRGHGALTVRPNQHLLPIQMSRHFKLLREQCNGDEYLLALALFVAADMAQAEDAVVLLGAQARPLLKKLEIELDQSDELDEQEGLFDKNQPEVPPDKSILNSILEGIETLNSN
jgi:hypothetical protein